MNENKFRLIMNFIVIFFLILIMNFIVNCS